MMTHWYEYGFVCMSCGCDRKVVSDVDSDWWQKARIICACGKVMILKKGV